MYGFSRILSDRQFYYHIHSVFHKRPAAQELLLQYDAAACMQCDHNLTPEDIVGPVKDRIKRNGKKAETNFKVPSRLKSANVDLTVLILHNNLCDLFHYFVYIDFLYLFLFPSSSHKIYYKI